MKLIYIFCIAEHFTMRNKLSHRGETFRLMESLKARMNLNFTNIKGAKHNKTSHFLY